MKESVIFEKKECEGNITSKTLQRSSTPLSYITLQTYQYSKRRTKLVKASVTVSIDPMSIDLKAPL